MENVSTEMLLILAGVTIAVLLQAGVLLGIFLTMRKAVQTAKEEADEYRAKLTPLIETASQLILTGKDLVVSTQTLINNLKPDLERSVAELSHMTQDVHGQVNRLQGAVDDLSARAYRQATRVDSMTTSFLNGVDRFGTFLNDAVHVPVRQVNGVVAAAKAVIDTLRAPAPPRPPRAPRRVNADEKDLFV